MKTRNYGANKCANRFFLSATLVMAAVFWAFNLRYPAGEAIVVDRPVEGFDEQIFTPVTQFITTETKEVRSKAFNVNRPVNPAENAQNEHPDGDEQRIEPQIASLPHSEETEELDETTIFYVPEVQPEFPGGSKGIARFIRNAVRYPEIALENRIGGRVKVSFIVEKDGSLSDIQVVGKAIGYGLEEEALRLVKSMPRWTPGSQGNVPVRVRFVLPIDFMVY